MTIFKCINPFCPHGKNKKIYTTKRGLFAHYNNSNKCMKLVTKKCFNIQKSIVMNSTVPNIMAQSFLNNETFMNETIKDISFSEKVRETNYFNKITDDIIFYDDNSTVSSSQSSIASSVLSTDMELKTNEHGSCSNEQDSIHTTSTNSLPTIFTVEQRSIISLMKILEDMNCPDDALPKILAWAHKAYIDGFEFSPRTKSRKSNINWMKKLVVNHDSFFPTSTTVALNNNIHIDVVHYDFVPQILCLLQDPKIMIQENLLIDVNNPCKMYQSKDGLIGDALSGQTYRDIFKQLKSKHSGDNPLLVVPICLWGDATHIDTYGRFKIEPWSFAPLIFKEKNRRNNDFWGMLGFVKHLKMTTAQKGKLKQGDTNRMYHKQLSAIFASLCACEKNLKNIILPIGNNKSNIFDIVCPVLYIIADTEGADKVCGRYAGHRLEIKRHCRMCNVTSINLDNEMFKYKYLKQSDMHNIAMNGTDEQRKAFSQHKVFNACQNVNFGGQEFGVLGCTPPDILHVVRKGIVEWSVRAVIDNLTDTNKAKLDNLTIIFHNQHRQRYRYEFPKTNFPSGFTNLSNVRASEWIGILYLLVILSQTQEGWDVINNALVSGNNGQLRDVLSVFEMILCFDAWINQDTFWPTKSNDMYKESAMKSIQILMKKIKRWLPAPQRNQGWKNPKFHLLTHFVDMIERFGAPKNYDSQHPERNHKYNAKRPGRRSQKTNYASEFEKQVARRVSEDIIINKLYDEINNYEFENKCNEEEREENASSKTTSTIEESTNSASYATAFVTLDGTYAVKWFSKKNDNMIWQDENISSYLCKYYNRNEVIFCTEYVRGGIRYRCHPNYQNRGPFYDWLLILFLDGDIDPCKLIVVIPGDQNGFDGYHLLIKSPQNKIHYGSALFQDYQMNKEYQIVEADAVYGPCFVVEPDPGKTIISLAKEKNTWPSLFTHCYGNN